MYKLLKNKQIRLTAVKKTVTIMLDKQKNFFQVRLKNIIVKEGE